MEDASQTRWLLYCRPGFEPDCVQEVLNQATRYQSAVAKQPRVIAGLGYATVVLGPQPISYRQLVFTRQLIRVQHAIEELPERDRLTPILDAVAKVPGTFGTLWLEVPDTNVGKQLSTFIRHFQPLLEMALRKQGRLLDVPEMTRLHIFFPNRFSAMIGSSDPTNSSNARMGIRRQPMPPEAPSRSTMKLAEAIEVFMDRGEQARLLRDGMRAVDLGASPGGWTWQLVKRGVRVTAVDNGPMKGLLAAHPLVTHLRQDGFKYMPRKGVDWLVCDMVEKPSKVATLVGLWMARGWCRHAIFNLKLPMKQRIKAVESALDDIRKILEEDNVQYSMIAKQLYHDREEVTVYLTRTRK